MSDPNKYMFLELEHLINEEYKKKNTWHYKENEGLLPPSKKPNTFQFIIHQSLRFLHE